MNDTTEQFVSDMEEAGYEVFPYAGRNFYRGPAVRGLDTQDIIRATQIRLTFDGMGRGVVAHPPVNDDEWYDRANEEWAGDE